MKIFSNILTSIRLKMFRVKRIDYSSLTEDEWKFLEVVKRVEIKYFINKMK
jgi:hypothetical protein